MNRYHIKLLHIFLFTLIFSTLEAQIKQNSLPPKLGLCLSGGGSKGLAHIGLLRMMDSLGIVPDYITGTSMGSIVGGLYAIGYSGDDLKKIALGADWTVLLGTKLPISDINIEEKDEFGRYWLEMPWIRGKLKLPKGIIKGQALQEYLIGLTFAARHIRHFDSLPIPFRCLAADLNTGKSVLLTEGSLTEALRASMAIPLLFTPIEKDSLLLIDGGLGRNFPVKEVIDMGATKVLGSYTGFRVLQSDELVDGSKILLQSIALLMSNSGPEGDKKLCDVWVNNELPGLYSTSFDPSNIRAMIEGGEANARALLPELQKIADWQHAQKHFPKRTFLKNDTTLLPLKSIIIEGEHSESSNVLIERKFGIEQNQRYTATDISHGLNQLYGSLFFNKITVDVDSADNGSASTIRLHTHESPRSVFKLGIHYDTDDAAGILINGTFRNFLGYNSRLSVTTDFAERPKAHIRYYQFIGSKARYRWTFDGLVERSLHNDFLFIKASEGRIKSRDKYLNSYEKAALGGQFIMNKNTLFFLEMRAVKDATTPQRDPRSNPIPNEISFLKNQSRHRGIVIGGLQNTQNNVFFPTKGQQLLGEIKLGLKHNAEFTTFQFKDTIKKTPAIPTSTNQSYIRYRLDEQRWIPLSEDWSLGLQASLGAGFSLNKNKEKTNLLDNPETFYIGGTNLLDRDNTLSFIGLRKAEVEFSQCMIFGVSGQYHLGKSFYFSTSANIGRFSDNHKQFYTRLWDWQFVKDIGDPIQIQASQPTHILGYGLNLGYSSKIGPVNLLVHSNTFTHSWYVFFSFGFKMP